VLKFNLFLSASPNVRIIYAYRTPNILYSLCKFAIIIEAIRLELQIVSHKVRIIHLLPGHNLGANERRLMKYKLRLLILSDRVPTPPPNLLV